MANANVTAETIKTLDPNGRDGLQFLTDENLPVVENVELAPGMEMVQTPDLVDEDELVTAG